MITKTFASLAATTALLATAATAQSNNGGRKLQTTLTGAAEVPGPGDTDGAGTAEITVNAGQSQVWSGQGHPRCPHHRDERRLRQG